MLGVVVEQRFGDGDEFPHARVRKPVDDGTIVAAGGDEAAPAQAAEVCRHGRLRHLQQLHQLARGELAGLVQQPQDPQPRRIAEPAEVLRDQIGLRRRVRQDERRRRLKELASADLDIQYQTILICP